MSRSSFLDNGSADLEKVDSSGMVAAGDLFYVLRQFCSLTQKMRTIGPIVANALLTWFSQIFSKTADANNISIFEKVATESLFTFSRRH